MLTIDELDPISLSSGEEKAVDLIRGALLKAPKDVSVLQMTRALLFWAAKLRLQYQITDPYPVSLSLRNYTPKRKDAAIQIEAAQASLHLVQELEKIRLTALKSPKLEKIDASGEEMTLFELEELIRKKVYGEELDEGFE